MKKRFLAIVFLTFITVLTFVSCGDISDKDVPTHTHSYIDRDGRILCSTCQELCVHIYEQQGDDVYCTNCLYKCKHKFKTNNGKRICEYCNFACIHSYELQDKVYKCVKCQNICSHSYKTIGAEMICSECGAKKIILTTENINEYLSVECRYEFVKKVTLSPNKYIYGKISFDIAPKKYVEFEDLQLEIKFTTLGNGWSSDWNFSKTVDIAYDGTGSFILDIHTPAVGEYAPVMNSPILVTAEIIEVMGTTIE